MTTQQADPISDDNVRPFTSREILIEEMAKAELRFGMVEIDRVTARQILARLDAAESRAAELQREVERLQVSLTPVCSLPVESVPEMEDRQC